MKNRSRTILTAVTLCPGILATACNNHNTDHDAMNEADTMTTMPAAAPAHTDTRMPLTPPAIADTSQYAGDSMPVR